MESCMHRFHWTCGPSKEAGRAERSCISLEPWQIASPFLGEEVEQLGNQVLLFQLLIICWSCDDFRCFQKHFACDSYLISLEPTLILACGILPCVFFCLLRWRLWSKLDLKDMQLLHQVVFHVKPSALRLCQQKCQLAFQMRVPLDHLQQTHEDNGILSWKKRCPSEVLSVEVHENLRKTKHSNGIQGN